MVRPELDAALVELDAAMRAAICEGTYVTSSYRSYDLQATYFLSCNRNKESISLDLKSDDGVAVLRDLVRRADVLVENFRPGVLDRLGFSPAQLHELNPRLVILSISGFGHDGPEAKRSGYDQIVLEVVVQDTEQLEVADHLG